MKITVVTPSLGQLDLLRCMILSLCDAVIFANQNITDFTLDHRIYDGGSANWNNFISWLENVLQDKNIKNYKVVAVQESDQGMYDALNKGFEDNESDYSMWLNSDEQVLKKGLFEILKMIEIHPETEVFFGDVMILSKDWRAVGYRKILIPRKSHTRMCHLHSYSCAMVMKTSVLPSPPFDSRWKVIGDAVLVDKFINSKRKMKRIGEIVSIFQLAEENLSFFPSAERLVWLRELKWTKYVKFKNFVSAAHKIRLVFNRAVNQRDVYVEYYTPVDYKKNVFSGKVPGKWGKIIRNI